MKFYFLFACVLLSLASTATAQEVWRAVESDNFRVTGQTPESDLRRVAESLEKFRADLRRNFNQAAFVAKIKTEVFIGKNELGGNRFQAGDDANFIALEAATIDRQILRGYTDDAIRRNLGRSRIPAWLNQGVIEFAAGNLAPEIESSFSIEDLLKLDYFAFGNLDAAERRDFNARSAALIRYLFAVPDRREKFNRFLELILTGKSSTVAFRTIFGSNDAALDKDLTRFAAVKIASSTTGKSNAKLETKTVAVSAAEANARLAEMLLQFDDLNAAEAAARKSLDENSAAHAALGAILARQKNFPEAIKYLEKAVALDKQNALAHFRLAAILNAENADKFGGALEREKFARIQDLLDRAMELNPNFAAAYQLAAKINLNNDANFAESLELLDQAAALEPGNQIFALDRAEALLRLERYTEAREIAAKIAANPGDKDIRLMARTLIASLDFIAARLREEANPNNGDRKREPSKVLTPEEAYLQSLNEALRKLKAGEQRVFGRLTALECGANGVLFVVNTDTAQLKFRAAEIKKVRMIAFVPNLDGQNLACGTQSTQISVVATFNPANEKTNPELIALEFVPENFRFLP